MFQIVKRNPRAAVIAVLMHLVIIAFLIVGVDWLEKPKQPKSGVEVIQARIVDREELKALNKEEAKLTEQKRLAELEKKRKTQEQERIRKQKQQEAERVKKQQASAKAKKAEKEKARKEAEAKKQLAQEKKRKAAAEKKRREEKARKLGVEKKRKAEEAKRLAADKKRKAKEAERLAAEKKRKEAKARAKKAAAEKARKEAEAKRRAEEQRRREIEAQRQAEIDAHETNRYLVQIQQKINRSWVRPSGIGEGLSCRLRVRLAPGGAVIAVSVLESSGSGAFDRSASNAVLKADPLPVPGGGLFEKFRDINFVFKPNR